MYLASGLHPLHCSHPPTFLPLPPPSSRCREPSTIRSSVYAPFAHHRSCQSDGARYNSIDFNTEYPAPEYPWSSHPDTAEVSQAELPTLDLEREVVGVRIRSYASACLPHTQCSNFTCCGLLLPDLHALVEHFEETHIVFPKPSETSLFILPEDRPPCSLACLVIPFPRSLTPLPKDCVLEPYNSPSTPLWTGGLHSPVADDDLLAYSKPSQMATSPSLPPASFTASMVYKKLLNPKSWQDRECAMRGVLKDQNPRPTSIKRGRGFARGHSYICPVSTSYE